VPQVPQWHDASDSGNFPKEAEPQVASPVLYGTETPESELKCKVNIAYKF